MVSKWTTLTCNRVYCELISFSVIGHHRDQCWLVITYHVIYTVGLWNVIVKVQYKYIYWFSVLRQRVYITNIFSPAVACSCQWTWCLLVQACWSFSVRPLPVSMLTYCQFHHRKQITLRFCSKYKWFLWSKCVSRSLKWALILFRPPRVNDFVPGRNV